MSSRCLRAQRFAWDACASVCGCKNAWSLSLSVRVIAEWSTEFGHHVVDRSLLRRHAHASVYGAFPNFTHYFTCASFPAATCPLLKALTASQGFAYREATKRVIVAVVMVTRPAVWQRRASCGQLQHHHFGQYEEVGVQCIHWKHWTL